MKKLTLLIVLLVAAGTVQADPNEAITISVLTAPTLGRANVETWLGYQRDNSQVGAIIGYLDEQTDEDASMTFGIFGCYHFPDVRTVIENAFWPVDFLPEAITAEPSVGLALVYNHDNSTLKVAPFVALTVYKMITIQTAYNAYGGGTEEEDGVTVGLCASFKL
jgi:hypothetical protein